MTSTLIQCEINIELLDPAMDKHLSIKLSIYFFCSVFPSKCHSKKKNQITSMSVNVQNFNHENKLNQL